MKAYSEEIGKIIAVLKNKVDFKQAEPYEELFKKFVHEEVVIKGKI